MRTLLVFLITLFVNSESKAQVWVEDNAHWTYAYWNLGSLGYYKVGHISDTLLGGKTAANYAIEISTYYYTQSGGIIYVGAGVQSVVSIYNSNDSVFWWRNNQWSLLLDFSAQTGASWFIAENESNWDPYCTDVAVVTVTDFGVSNIDGINYRYIDLEQSSDSPLRLTGRYYERFGGSFFIPLQQLCDPNIIMEYDMISGLRCFSDDSLAMNFVGEDCNYLETHLSLKEQSEHADQYVFPNPSTGDIYFREQVECVQVFDLSGKLLHYDKFEVEQEKIDLSFLDEGVYLIVIKKKNDEVLTTRVSIKSDQ